MLVTCFFNRWPTHLIFQIYTLNYNIHHIIRFYIQRTWNPALTLFHWFRNPAKFLHSLTETDAVVCGPVVMQYFHRGYTPLKNLDICVRLGGLRELGRVVVDEGFVFYPSTGDFKNFDSTALVQSGKRFDSESLTNRRTRTDPYMRNFHFEQCVALPDGTSETFSITIHLIRWEPWRFILCAESSKCNIPRGNIIELTTAAKRSTTISCSHEHDHRNSSHIHIPLPYFCTEDCFHCGSRIRSDE